LGQRYLQHLQNEIIPVAGMWTHIFPAEWSTSTYSKCRLGGPQHVFGSSALSNRCRWFWPPRSPDMNPYDYFLWCYLKDHAYRTNPHTVPELEAELKLLLKRSQVTCCVAQMTTLWFICSESMRSNYLRLTMCSHEDHTHTKSP